MRRVSCEEYMEIRPSRHSLAHYITYRPNMISDGLCD